MLFAASQPLQVGKTSGRPQNLAVAALPDGRALVTRTPPATDGGLPVTAYARNTTGTLRCRTTR